MNAPGKQLVPLLVFFLVLGGCSGAPIAPQAGSPSFGSAPAEPLASRAKTLWVSADLAPGSVASVPAGSKGLVSASTLIKGSATNPLAFNYYDWFDAKSGRVWTTNCASLAKVYGPVVAFRSTDSGDVTPAIVLGGRKTGLFGCQLGVVVDPEGNVYVADIANASGYPGGHIAIFGPAQRGNVAPAAAIAGSKANFHSPTGIALDAKGNLYVADSCQGYSCTGDVQVFGPGANGNVASSRIISGPATAIDHPQGLAVDAAGYLYVATTPDTIAVFAPGAKGNATPVRLIHGKLTKLDRPTGIAVDALGYLYVGTRDASHVRSVHLPVLVFAPRASGNVLPKAAITFKSNAVAVPSGVALQ